MNASQNMIFPATQEKRLAPLIFALLSSFMIFHYFEVPLQRWFLELLHGFVIRVWIPPMILFFCMVIKNLTTGSIKLNHIRLKMDSILVVSIVLYALCGTAAMFFNEPLFLFIKYSLIIVNPVIFFALITEHFRDNRDIERFLKIFFVCGILQAIYSFVKFKTWMMAGMPPIEPLITNLGFPVGESMEAVSSAGLARAVVSELVVRFSDFSIEAGKFGAMLFPLVLLGIYYGLKSSGWRRYFFLSSGVFIFMLVVATLSRSVILAAFVGSAVFFRYLSKYRLRNLRMRYLLFLIIPMILFFLMNIEILLRFGQLFASIPFLHNFAFMGDLIEKYDIYVQPDSHIFTAINTLSLFLNNPFFGVGYTAIVVTPPEIGEWAQTPELNRYLIILASSGVIAFAFYLLFIVSLIRVTHRTVVSLHRKNQAGLMMGLVLLASTVMFSVKILNSGEESLHYWMFFSLAAAWTRNCRMALNQTGVAHEPTIPRGDLLSNAL